MDSTTQKLKAAYEEFPYDALVHPQTYPDHLAAIAVLDGLSPPPVDSSRVLEIGCAAGSNLLPMAEFLPRSRFLGVDLSSRQIDEWLKGGPAGHTPNDADMGLEEGELALGPSPELPLAAQEPAAN